MELLSKKSEEIWKPVYKEIHIFLLHMNYYFKLLACNYV